MHIPHLPLPDDAVVKALKVEADILVGFVEGEDGEIDLSTPLFSATDVVNMIEQLAHQLLDVVDDVEDEDEVNAQIALSLAHAFASLAGGLGSIAVNAIQNERDELGLPPSEDLIHQLAAFQSLQQQIVDRSEEQ